MKISGFKYSLVLLTLILASHLSSFSQNPSWMYWDPWTCSIPSRFIADIAIDEEGVKWIATEPVCGGGICTDGGLAAFDGTNWIVYDSLNSSLNSNFIGAVTLDPDEVVWVGTGHGEVSSFDGNNWESHPFPTKDNVAIKSMASDLYGYIWVATEGSGLYMFDDTAWDHYHSGNSILPDYLNSVAAGPDNSVWTGGTGNKLYKYTGAWIESSLPDDIYFTSAIAIDHENRIWVGSEGVFCNYYAGEWTVFDENITGIPDSSIGYVFDIEFGLSGNTWIGHSKGLIKYDGSEWHTYEPSNSGLLSENILSLAADELGNLWIGTADTGLIAYQEGGVVGISELRTLNSELRISLAHPFPNPSGGAVNIQYELFEPTPIQLSIIDLYGRTVRILEDGTQNKGIHKIIWDGRNDDGSLCPPGIYLIRIICNNTILSRQIILQ